MRHSVGMYCTASAASAATISRSPTTPAVTGTAPSARVVRRIAGSKRARPSAATGIDGDQGNTAFSGKVVAVHVFGRAINPNSNAVIPVAILGSVNFDATQVDFSRAVFGSRKASPIHDGVIKDVNHDGIVDMVFHFNTRDTGISCGDPDATLSGETFGGDAFTGTYSVRTAGCR